MSKEKEFINEVSEEEVLELTEMSKFVKSVSKSFKTIDDANQARFTIDSYYQMQDMRINCENKIRADIKGMDNPSPNPKENMEKFDVLQYQCEMYRSAEENLTKILDAYSDSNYLSRWARKTMGIGPILAASLPVYLQLKIEDDGSTKMHAASWWSYCGLNDHTHPWLGREASKKIINEAIERCGGVLNDEAMAIICANSQWKIEHFENFKDCLKINKKGERKWNKDAVIKACSVIPYNKKLKVVCYKIGTSFHKLCNNEKSMYGRLFRERLQYEMEKNERGDYAEQAARILSEKNFTSDIKKEYEAGRLPISHIYMRCERYVTKLFISHAFEAAYYNQYGTMPPVPYALCFCEGHTDYIGPEVPYESIPRDCELK